MYKIFCLYWFLAVIAPLVFGANTLQYLTSFSLPQSDVAVFRYIYFHGDGTTGSLNGCLVDSRVDTTEFALYSIGIDFSGKFASSSTTKISLPASLIPAGSQYCSTTPIQGLDTCSIAGVCDTSDKEKIQYFNYLGDQDQTLFGEGPWDQMIPMYSFKTNTSVVLFYRPANGTKIDSRIDADQPGPHTYVSDNNNFESTKVNLFEVMQLSPDRYIMTSSIENELSAKIEDCTMTSCTTVGLVDFSYLKFISDGTNWFAVGLAAQTLTSTIVGVRQNGSITDELPTEVYPYHSLSLDISGVQVCLIDDSIIVTTHSPAKTNYSLSALNPSNSFSLIQQVRGNGAVKAMHCKDNIIAVVTTEGIDYYAWNLDLDLESPSSLTPVTTPSGLKPEEEAGLIAALVVGSVVIAGAIVLAVLLSKRRQKKNNKPNNTEAVENLPLNQFSKKLLIPYKDLGFTKEIGAGSFGKVFIGEWRGVSVAIKMNNRQSSKDAESFLSEAKLTLQLPPHPNVVQTFGVSLDSEFPYIVLEFCNGGSLDKILSKQQQLTAAEQQTLVKGIAFGLLHLHSHNIVHRDLAARNILVGDHKPKISDFGMSRVLKDGAQQGQTASRLGPVRWMAPESIRDAVYSTKSDVWAFGIVVSEIVNGHEPHFGEDQLDVAAKIRDEAYTPSIPQDCDPVLREIMEKCWKSNPDDRPTMYELCQLISQNF